jgi:hypothetical protein
MQASGVINVLLKTKTRASEWFGSGSVPNKRRLITVDHYFYPKRRKNGFV